MHELIKFDKELFLYLNSKHTPWLDPIMSFLSSYIGLAIIAICILFYTAYRCWEWKWVVVTFALFTVGTTNLINNIVKIIIARPRPIHEEVFNDIIHAIEKYDAAYSFFSAHSSSSLALAVFVALATKNRYFTAIVLLWGVSVAYSRIYVGKHYPLDIIVGMIFGSIMAFVGYILFNYYKAIKTGRMH